MKLRSAWFFVGLSSLLAPAPALAQSDACTKDTECQGANVCEGGRCVPAGKAPVPPEAAPPVTEPVATATTANPDAASNDAAPREPFKPRVWGTRLSAFYTINAGVAGNLQAANAVHSVGVELSHPLGSLFRYRGAVGFLNTNSLNGLRLEPLGLALSYEIPLPTDAIRLAVEPMASLVQADVYIDVGGTGSAAVAFSSGFDLGAVAKAGPVILGLHPVGLDFRYHFWVPDVSASITDVGVNWRSRITVGFEL